IQWLPIKNRHGRALPTHYRCSSSIYSNDDEPPVTNVFGIIRKELQRDKDSKQRRCSNSTTETTRSLLLTLHPNINILDSPALENPFASNEYAADGYISNSDVQEYRALVEADEGYGSKTDLIGKN